MAELIIYLVSAAVCTGIAYWGWTLDRSAVTLGNLVALFLIVLTPIANTILALLGAILLLSELVSTVKIWDKVIIKGRK